MEFVLGCNHVYVNCGFNYKYGVKCFNDTSRFQFTTNKYAKPISIHKFMSLNSVNS